MANTDPRIVLKCISLKNRFPKSSPFWIGKSSLSEWSFIYRNWHMFGRSRTGRVTVWSQKAKKPPLLFEQGLSVSKNICQQEGGGGQPPPPTVQRRPDSGDWVLEDLRRWPSVAAASHLQTSTRPTQTRCSDSPKKCLRSLQIWELSLSFSESSVTELVWVKMCICARWWASPKLASPKTLERKWGLVTGPGTRQDRRNTK